jgi:integrase
MRELLPGAKDGYMFPGLRNRRNSNERKSLSNMAMTKMMVLIGYGDFTVHGFRSTFKDWACDCTTFPRELSEAALSHTVGDMVEQAYRRSDALEMRRQLMEAWARYCDVVAGENVVPLTA